MDDHGYVVISDFGMSKMLKKDGTYIASKG